MSTRQYSPLDHLLIHIDRGLKTLTASHLGERTNPGRQITDQQGELNSKQRRHSAGLMRINHCGEVSAQALYQGQSIAARDPQIKRNMQHSAEEENDHLDWCRERLEQLGSHTSYLNVVWYMGALAIGLLAGVAGDRWSLGFVAETERQVVRHLDDHLATLPKEDQASQAILQQMREDEQHHATVAVAYGAYELPSAIRMAMTVSSQLMKKTAYWL